MSNTDYAAKLGDAFLTIFAATRSRKRKKRLAKAFFDTLQKDTVMKEVIVEFGKKHLHNNIFDPFSVLQLMDLKDSKVAS
jgi:hypothetical protein